MKFSPDSVFVVLRRGLLLSLIFAATASRGADHPNILFIVVDDLRPELGCYRDTPVKTPHIDRLASEGTLFRRAYCQQALCAPSRASVLTGLRPDSAGITDLSHPVRTTLPDVLTLPQHFRENGYTTLSLGKIYHHAEDDNTLGWSVPAWLPPGLANQAADPANAPLTPNGRTTAWECIDVPDTAYPDGKIAARAVEQLAALAQSQEPFFLAVGFLKPHLPFFAPKKYWDLYSPADIELPLQQSWPENMPAIAGMNWEELRNYRDIPKHGSLDETLARTLIRGYYASVSYVDAQIGRVLAQLDASGLRDNTIVVLWGDHGWKLGDYGAWCKHTNFEHDTHVPLIVSTPRQSARGQSTNALVELVDLYPTLSQLSGFEIPAHCEGTSFAALLDDPSLPGKPAAFSLYPRLPVAIGYTVRDARWRYTEWRKPTTNDLLARELYDHRENATAPANLVDSPAHAVEAARLSALLADGEGWRNVKRPLASEAVTP